MIILFNSHPWVPIQLCRDGINHSDRNFLIRSPRNYISILGWNVQLMSLLFSSSQDVGTLESSMVSEVCGILTLGNLQIACNPCLYFECLWNICGITWFHIVPTRWDILALRDRVVVVVAASRRITPKTFLLHIITWLNDDVCCVLLSTVIDNYVLTYWGARISIPCMTGRIDWIWKNLCLQKRDKEKGRFQVKMYRVT